MSEVKRLLLATRNSHKTREFAAIMGPEFLVTDLSRRNDVPLIAETGTTFAENAALKAIGASSYVNDLVVGDDSGLEVDALGAAPGVYSARYAGEGATDAANVAKLLEKLAHAADPRTAQFRCALALARAGKLIAEFSGSVTGTIAADPSGSGGFGYDPVFVPSGFEQTFGELPAATKDQMSHRARAVKQLREFLRQNDAA